MTLVLVHPHLSHPQSIATHVGRQVLRVRFVGTLNVCNPRTGQDLHAAAALPHLQYIIGKTHSSVPHLITSQHNYAFSFFFFHQFPLLRSSLREQKHLGTWFNILRTSYSMSYSLQPFKFSIIHPLEEADINVLFRKEFFFFILLSCFQSFPSQDSTAHHSWRKYLCVSLQ